MAARIELIAMGVDVVVDSIFDARLRGTPGLSSPVLLAVRRPKLLVIFPDTV